jgi:DNA-binding beta-propeller fold protein YncE
VIRTALLLSLLSFVVPAAAAAQIVGIALDAKVELVNGDLHVLPKPPADAAVFLSFSGTAARTLGEVPVPTGFQGPPSSLAIAADGRLALVAASQRVDANDQAQLAPDRTLSVIDLAATPMRATQTIALDASPAGIAIHPDGKLALVAHTADNSVSVLAIADGRVRVVEKLALGDATGPLAVAFAPDGRRARISFPERARVGVYAVEQGRLRLPAIRELSAGVYPASLAYCGTSGLAVVANYGRVTGDADTISLLDVGAALPRVIDTASVGPSPEGVACAPDGRHAAAALQNMSTVANDAPFHAADSRLVVLRIENRRLTRVAEAPFGPWAQGVGFIDDKTLFAQSMGDRSLHVFRLDGDALREAAPIRFAHGAPAAYGISGR